IAQATQWIASLPGRAANALGNLAGVLTRAGMQLIQGFINGIVSRIPGVRQELSGLTSMLPSWKGPESADRRLLTPAGEALIEGLIRGIERATPRLRRELQGLSREIGAWRPSASLAMDVAPAAVRGAAAGALAGGLQV